MSASSASHYAPPGSAEDRNRRCEVVVDGPTIAQQSSARSNASAGKNLASGARSTTTAAAAPPSVMRTAKAYVRTRPSQRFANDRILIQKELGQEAITILKPRNPDAAHFLRDHTIAHTYGMDGVLHNASQEEVYKTVCEPIMKNVLDGYNGAVICNGQVGSGKTHTITGSVENFDERGLVPRALSHAFGEQHDVPENEFRFHISYMELYNDDVHDLLSGLPSTTYADIAQPPLRKLPVTESKEGVVAVGGLRIKEVFSLDDALNCLFEGDVYRAKSQHVLNPVSSRSHTLLTFYIQRNSLVDTDSKETMFSRIDFVDLAGMERPSKTQPTGKTQQEALHINRSLSFLEQTLRALSTSSPVDKPSLAAFRQDKLSHVLKHCIGGNCQTAFLTNIRTEVEHVEETLSSLQFSEKAVSIPIAMQTTAREPANLVVRKQQLEIELLREELAAQSIVFGGVDIHHEPFSQPEVERIREKVTDFLESGDISGLKIESVRQTREIFQQFRQLYREQAETFSSQLSAAENAFAASYTAATLAGPDGAGVGGLSGTEGGGGGGVATAMIDKTPHRQAKTKEGGKQVTVALDTKPVRGAGVAAAGAAGAAAGAAPMGKKSFKTAVTSLKGKKASDVVAKEEPQETGVGDLNPTRDGIAIRAKKSLPAAGQDFAFATKLQADGKPGKKVVGDGQRPAGSAETGNLAQIPVAMDTPGATIAPTHSMDNVGSGVAMSSALLQDGSQSSLAQTNTSGSLDAAGKKMASVLGRFMQDSDTKPTKEDYFEWYKQHNAEGKELNGAFILAKKQQHDQAILVRNHALDLSKFKDAIGEIQQLLAAGTAKEALETATGIPQLQHIKGLSKMISSLPHAQCVEQITAVYKTELGKLAMERADLNQLKETVQDKRRTLLSAFEAIDAECNEESQLLLAAAKAQASGAMAPGSLCSLSGENSCATILEADEDKDREDEDDDVEDLTQTEGFGVADNVALDTMVGHLTGSKAPTFANMSTDPRENARAAFDNARVRARKRENQILRKTGHKPGAIIKAKPAPTSTLRSI
ncbi:uncharacterized protein LOC135812028 [Sycon ciliatum]|uniref:uncharacterized protein LOC135812028 n=1 Tax=Sycon ciliatum TaxID=27933 RepID=UPI0031F665F5